MVDRSLWPRLKRLFGNNVVIRNVGGKTLKTTDIDKVQAYGNLQTNSLVDKFTRLHRSGYTQIFGPQMNYQTMRLSLYSDYEAMDTDGIISAVLDVLSEECTLKNETGDVITVRSSNEDIQDILYDLFYNVLNIEFNLPVWTRSMCKYGDLFLKLDIEEKFGVYNVIPFSSYDLFREEGYDSDNKAYVRFIYDPTYAVSGLPIARDKMIFEDYEIAHFRYLSDTNYLPYGRSYIEPARKLFKQLTLLEDAMLLHRIMRAPEKRVFYIDIGNIPANEVDAFMEKTISKMKKTPFMDQKTGDYNPRFNLDNMMEDFYIPKRGGSAPGTNIETTKGLEYAGIEDVEYIRDKMLAALKVPKAFLNYSDELNGKSTISALDLRFSRTVEKIQKILISELRKIAMVHLYVQGYEGADLVNFDLGLTSPSIIYEQEKVALLKEKMDLIGSIMDKKIVSSDWFYANIMNMTDDQINEQRDLLTEDAKRAFRINQIETEGNDPSLSGESYGTKHDLASIYKANADANTGENDVPDGYDEKKPVGRPKEKASIIGTDKSAFGRDPLGKIDMHDDGKEKVKYKPRGGAMALEAKMRFRYGKKVNILMENDNSEIGLLDERNLLDE